MTMLDLAGNNFHGVKNASAKHSKAATGGLPMGVGGMKADETGARNHFMVDSELLEVDMFGEFGPASWDMLSEGQPFAMLGLSWT